MQVVHKYIISLVEYGIVFLPKFAKILSIQYQGNDLCLWALVDPSNSLEKRVFQVLVTGEELKSGPFETWSHLATCQHEHSGTVVHIFEIV